MKNLSLTTVGAVSAVLTVVCFVVGIVLMASSGVQVLIPETGEGGLEWIADVDDAGGTFFAGAWLAVLGGVLGAVALIGFYAALRDAGPVMVLAPILGAVGLTLVTISHLTPIAMAYELVPGYGRRRREPLFPRGTDGHTRERQRRPQLHRRRTGLGRRGAALRGRDPQDLGRAEVIRSAGGSVPHG